MEEVDKIIIDSLRHLGCDIDEDINSLKAFSPDTVVGAISTCLETMNPQLKLPKKLPPSMSARIKLASSLAQQIKDFGFRGDMGYQTILYCNEVEVRRVLMFLIERLPKEQSPVAHIEPTGYVSKIVKQIEDNLKLSLNKMWLPTDALYWGTRPTKEGFIPNTFGSSYPIDNVNLLILQEDTSPEEAQYIPHITQQCTSKQLIPSLLWQKGDFSIIPNWKQLTTSTHAPKDVSKELLEHITTTSKSPEKILQIQNVPEDANIAETSNEVQETKTEALLNNLKLKKDGLEALQETVRGHEQKLRKIKSQKEEEQKHLDESLATVKIKNKTFAVLSNEENKAKLKNLIQKSQNRLAELASQWDEVQTTLLEEHKALKSSVSLESLKQQDEQKKLHNLKKTYKEMVADFKEKSNLEQNLIERCKELNNKNNRAAYTKRILEIVSNIKKQNKEIQKILADTKQVQKDINNLTGQVDRSFTLSDELIFLDCKHDESARKAYKLLAALRDECNGILQAVSDIGQAERELRNLEEQLEVERNKDTRSKLDSVQRDLAEIKKEIQSLM